MSGFNLSAWAVAHRGLTGFLIALIFAIGAFSYQKLGRSEDPPFTLKLMVVTAAWDGATAKEMQDQVSERIERKLQDLPSLDHIETYVQPGFVATLVVWRDDTNPADVPTLFYQTRKKLDDLKPDLPRGVQGPFANDEYTDVYGAMFAFSAPAGGADNATLVRFAEQSRDRLLKVPGAEKVTIFGEVPRTLFVEFSTSKLAGLGVTVPDIMAAISKQSDIAPAGLVETGNTRVPLRVSGAVHDAASLAEVPVAVDGHNVRLGDIATVMPGYQDPPQFLVRHNGVPAVVLAASMQKGTNGLDFGAAIRAEAARIRADLPLGVEMQQISDQPAVIADEVDEFLLKFVVALGVVLVVSFASLGWRTGIVVALAVPLSLAVVFAVMLQMGIELQRISLGALILSLGLLVDDAIIAIETMVVKLEEGWERTRAAGFAWSSTAFPMLSGTLVTVAGFLPVGIAKSSTGEYAGGIFWVAGMALLASWVVAVVFTPYLGVLLLPQPKRVVNHEAIYDTPTYRRLRRFVRGSVARKRLVVMGTFGLLFVAMAGMGLVKQQFFPNSARPELMVDFALRQGASIGATGAAVAKLEHALATDPEFKRDVRWFTSYIGQGAPRFVLTYNPTLPNSANATTVLVAADTEARERVRARLLQMADAEAIPEARLHVTRIELGPPTTFPVQFRVIGANLADVRDSADRLLAAIRTVPGVRNPQLAWTERAADVHLDLDQARVRQLGLSPADIAQALQTLLSGTTAASLRDGAKLIDVVLRAAPAERLTLDRLADLTLATPSGPLPVSQIARVSAQAEDPILWRRDRAPYINLQADMQDGLQAPDVTAAAMKVLGTVALPEGVRIEVGGPTEESNKANAALFAVFPFMLAAMLLLLMVQLQNLPRALMVIATAPLGIIGAVLALLAADAPFGFLALLGLIALAGMIMRNTIILVDQVRQDQEHGLPLLDAIIESTVRRSRPVVLTAIASAAAFVPLATNVFWGPMALVLIGGLCVATLLTLLFVPALYAWVTGARVAREPAREVRPSRAWFVRRGGPVGSSP